MKKVIIITSFLVLALFLFNVKDVFAMTCTGQGGFTVLCSDGLLYQIPSYIPASGNGAGYGSGSNYTVIGNNPSNYCPAGSLYDSSSGKCYSCPANSTYDSFSHNCNCDSGYTYSGSNCVSTCGFCEISLFLSIMLP